MTTPDARAEDADDRQAIRDLVDAWAHCADRRKPHDQAALFIADCTVTVYQGDPASNEPVQCLRGHAEMAEAFKVLDTYDATTHFNCQSTVSLDGDRATGETYCLAHHVKSEDGQATLLIIFIRYLDTFIRQSATWRFGERTLIIDWADQRPLSPGS
jgi:SnoaL-like domain